MSVAVIPPGSFRVDPRFYSRRAIVVLVIAAAHVTFILLAQLHGISQSRSQQEPFEISFVPLEISRGSPVATSPARSAEEHRARPRLRTRDEPATQEQAPASSAPFAAPIDWAKEAESVVARRLAADEAARRRAHALQPKRGMGSPAASKPPGFRWDRAHTHRLEVAPGALIWHFNERCLIAIIPFPIPLCQIGKIDSHGDLFEHMKDPPRLGEGQEP